MPGSWHREGGAGASAATSCSAGSWHLQPKREGRLVLGTWKAASAPRRRLLARLVLGPDSRRERGGWFLAPGRRRRRLGGDFLVSEAATGGGEQQILGSEGGVGVGVGASLRLLSRSCHPQARQEEEAADSWHRQHRMRRRQLLLGLRGRKLRRRRRSKKVGITLGDKLLSEFLGGIQESGGEGRRGKGDWERGRSKRKNSIHIYPLISCNPVQPNR